MHSSIDILVLALSLLVLVPSTFLFVQLLAGSLVRSPAAAQALPVVPSSLAVLMPAHDEAAGIAAAIRAVLLQLGSADRLMVVADNCSDDTAGTARALGAEVVERVDEAHRGKGYALDFGIRALAARPPDIVVIVDADCIVAPGALARLAAQCEASPRPIQALYLMHAPAGAPVGMRVAELAWLVKNKVRPLGSAAFGWPCQLMGTGMAFRWSTIEQASLASGHLVEDMQMGLDMASAGTPPLFCPEALVRSVFPSDREGVESQRTRWEHGHLSMITGVGPRLLWRALRRRDTALLAMALDLMVPPLASLVLLLAALLLLDAAWWGFGHSPVPLALSSLALAMVAAGVLLAWWREGRTIVSANELLTLPLYVAAKMPVYLRLLTRRQTQWVRTKRDERQP